MTFLPYMYWAYGSNLKLKRMAERCPASEPVSPYAITGWRLSFCGRRGTANVIYTGRGRDVVQGALYCVTKTCEAMLDRCEGYDHRSPGSGTYRKIDFRIRATGEDAFMYVMNDERPNAPDETYIGRMRTGYRDWGFELEPMMAVARACGYVRPNADVVRVRDQEYRYRGVGFGNGRARTEFQATVGPDDWEDAIGGNRFPP